MLQSRRAGAFGICVLLAVIHTWPLALHPGTYSRNDNADTQLNEWILAWVAHELPRDPRHLFQANIFYPAPDALAFSEPLIMPALIGAPLSWSGASPVLVYNLVLIAGFALTAFATFLLLDAWTGNAFAGLLAGSAFAFNTHTLTRLAHVQGIHLYGLPLALLGIDRIVRGGSYRAAILLAASLAVLAYTSGYLIVFAAVMLAIVLLARAADWWPRKRLVLPALALAAIASVAVIVPLYLPYRRVAREQHMVRSLDLIKEYSATPRGYLAASGRIHFSTWSGHFFKDPIDSFFPGFAILALAAIAIGAALRRRPVSGDPLRARVLMLVAIAVAGFVLSLGTATPVYGWLFTIFPPMQGLRAAARFGNLFLLAIAVLGGLGLSVLLPPKGGSYRISRGRISRGTWLAILLIVIVNVEALRAPFTYQRFNGIPGLYKLLAQEPGRVVVVEQPFFPRWAVFQNAPYVLASTMHWRPLMNGYSGYTPEAYQHYADAFWYFPDDWAITAMKDAGVTHVVVHPSGFNSNREPVIPIIEKRGDFELLAIGRDNIRLYRLNR
ncbi:MAG TPA: hypothetical protein VEL79_04855 [Vicinamibacterales bacterium]|nr:hypothetical protein [Vicinamibacterales bacterium]